MTRCCRKSNVHTNRRRSHRHAIGLLGTDRIVARTLRSVAATQIIVDGRLLCPKPSSLLYGGYVELPSFQIVRSRRLVRQLRSRCDSQRFSRGAHRGWQQRTSPPPARSDSEGSAETDALFIVGTTASPVRRGYRSDTRPSGLAGQKSQGGSARGTDPLGARNAGEGDASRSQGRSRKEEAPEQGAEARYHVLRCIGPASDLREAFAVL